MQQLASNGAGVPFSTQTKTVGMKDIYAMIDKKEITDAEWQQTNLNGKYLENGVSHQFEALVPAVDSQAGAALQAAFIKSGVNWRIVPPPVSATVFGFLSMIAFPLMILALIYFLVLRPAQMGGNQALSFGRSKAKRVGETGPKITFDDVAGIEEAKQELFEIVDFLKNT
jgi:cell division protease FtsH